MPASGIKQALAVHFFLPNFSTSSYISGPLLAKLVKVEASKEKSFSRHFHFVTRLIRGWWAELDSNQ